MRKRLADILKWAWLAAVLIGAGWYFYRHYHEITSYLETLSVVRITASFILLIVGKVILSDITRMSLKKVNWKISFREALSITSVTQLGKYLPGGIWHFAGKFGAYKVKGVSTKDSTQAMIYENTWLLSSAVVIGLLLLLSTNQELTCTYLSFLCDKNLIPFLLIGMPIIWLGGLFIIEKFFFYKENFAISDFLIVLLEQLGIWTIFGFSFWFIFPPNVKLMPQIIGSFSLSWAAGYIAFFAPGGIGVREFLITIFLGTFFASSEVAVYAAVHRLIWVLVEILLGIIGAVGYGLPDASPMPPTDHH